MLKEIYVINKVLIDEVLAGDTAAKRRFVQLSQKYIYGALHTFDGLSDVEMNDLFQTVYLKLFEDNARRIRMWNGESQFTTYLYRIVINIVKDYLGSAYVRYSGSVRRENERPGDERNFEETLPVQDRLDECDSITLMWAVRQLNEKEQHIIDLYYFQGMKEREIAQHLDRPLNTVSSLKNRTLKKLNLLMQENN